MQFAVFTKEYQSFTRLCDQSHRRVKLRLATTTISLNSKFILREHLFSNPVVNVLRTQWVNDIFVLADLKSEIQSQVDKMAATMDAKKFGDMANFYTDDCKLMPPGSEMIVGKEGKRGS